MYKSLLRCDWESNSSLQLHSQILNLLNQLSRKFSKPSRLNYSFTQKKIKPLEIHD